MIQAKTHRPAGSTKALALGLMLTALLAASLILTANKPAHAAATFTVSSTGDQPDASGSDGRCDVDGSAANGNQCTLRAAIQQANATPGADTIKFNILGGGVKTISPATELPNITGPVAIDGYTQPGSRKNTKQTGALDTNILVELNGSNAGSSSGLRATASNVVVRGLAVNRFANSGIEVSTGAQGVKVEGNFIGADATGTLDRGNGDGVSMKGDFLGDGAGGNNTVGGASPDQRNLISGNNGTAVSLDGAGSNKVQGNLIGVQKDATSILGGARRGVLAASPKNTIGGAVPGEANTIAFNFGAGVRVDGNFSTGNRILNNSIFSNGGLGIDLVGSSGRTDNDPGDIDSGANALQNFPVITSARKASGGKTTIRGNLDSIPGKTYKLRFFAGPSSSADEGEKFLVTRSVTTGPDGEASFDFEVSQPLAAGDRVTATATDPAGNTSEFSDPILAEGD